MAGTINILAPASDLGAAWVRALSLAAGERGWVVASGDAPTDGDQVMRIAFDLNAQDHAQRWVVICDQINAIWTSEIRPGHAQHSARDALRLTSRRLAGASGLAQAGAVVLDASALELDFPGLGRVRRDVIDEPAPLPAPSALEIYTTLPPPLGASSTWAVDLFSYPKGGELEGGAPAMDLTGRARNLFHGPYFELPPGVWQVRLRFDVDPVGAPLRFKFDWGAGEDMTSVSPTIARPGQYNLTISRRWPAAGPAEVRAWIMQGAFQGRFEFHGCTVSRLADDETDRDMAA